MSSSSSLRYRPDIDGLRAIAVMLVVNFHAFPEAMPGGFIGVDILFVISGFLITGIIVRELEQQRFSLLGFYIRRIRRIFPALIVVLCATLVLGWLWILPMAYAQLSADVFASAAFFANIALMLQSGYFDIESGKKPLLHLWSLGIEEQFYLFWPLILMLVARLRLSILAAASVIGIASFVLNVALIDSHPVATFYLPFTRAWELAAGAALACGCGRRGADRGGRRRSRYPPRLSGLVGALARGRWGTAIVRARGMGLSSCIGQPAAGLDRADQLPAVSVALATAGIFRAHQVRLPPEIRAMAEVQTDSSSWRFHECLLDLDREMSFADSCVDRARRPLLMLWGDSTAGALLPGLRKAQETRDFGIAQFTSSSCIPALNADIAVTPKCLSLIHISEPTRR